MTHRKNMPLFKVRPIGSNQTEVQHGNVKILYSYETPVAVAVVRSIPPGGTEWYVTDKKWSVVTKRHINKWLTAQGAGQAEKVSQDVIENIASSGQGPVSFQRNPCFEDEEG